MKRGITGAVRQQNTRLSEAEANSRLQKQENEYIQRNEKLLEKWEKTEGLGLGNGVLAEMVDKNYYNALALARVLENTEVSFNNTLREYQTSSYLGITPQEIVKVFRFSYGNSIAPDLFNFWAMESVKDTFYKIETKYGSTKRGETEGEVIYENYGNGGRYTKSTEEESLVGDGNKTNFTGTLPVFPAVPHSFKIYGPKGHAGSDINGVLGGTAVTGTLSGTIDYATGVYDITFTNAPATGEDYIIEYVYDVEDERLFDQVGEIKLDIVPYDFRAQWHSMQATWHRFAEEVSESKLGRSARQDLIDGVADVIRKSQDEFFVKRAIRASRWADAEKFDTDFANNGADSDYANAQALVATIENARGKAYQELGRSPARCNLLVSWTAKSYLRKIKGYSIEADRNEIGFFKDGELGGYGVYVAPSNVVEDNMIYMFGRGKDAMATDAVISVGMYKGAINSDELEFANFKNQLGFGYMMDYQINNKYMASRIELENLA